MCSTYVLFKEIRIGVLQLHEESRAKKKLHISYLGGVWLLLLKFSSSHIKRLTFK
jgi:hypothetical protein